MNTQFRYEGKLYDVSHHALLRYVERVKHIHRPTRAEQSRFCAELCNLLKLHATQGDTKPEWTKIDEERETTEQAEVWLTILDDITCPAVWVTDSKKFIITTVMTRGGFSAKYRTHRNAVKAQARRNVRNARQHRAWRGESGDRWT